MVSPQSNNLYPVSGCGLLGWSPRAAKRGFFDEGVVATLTRKGGSFTSLGICWANKFNEDLKILDNILGATSKADSIKERLDRLEHRLLNLSLQSHGDDWLSDTATMTETWGHWFKCSEELFQTMVSQVCSVVVCSMVVWSCCFGSEATQFIRMAAGVEGGWFPPGYQEVRRRGESCFNIPCKGPVPMT